MAPLKIKCPVCGARKSLFAKSGQVMLMLNCPDCHAPLLYYQGSTFKVSKEEIKSTIRNKNIHKMQELLDILSRYRPRTRSGKAAPHKPRQVVHSVRKSSSRSGKGKPDRKAPISHEEVIDLIIDINTTDSVSDFLEKLN